MDRKDLRSGNVVLLRNLLKSLRQATKPQLAKASGLSVVTVNAIMKVLVESGEAEATETAPSTGGRKALIYVFRKNRRLSLTSYTTTTDNKTTLHISVDNVFGENVESFESPLENVTVAAFVEVLQPFIKKYPQIPLLMMGLDCKTMQTIMDSPDSRDMPFDRQLTAKLEHSVRQVSETEAAAANAEHLFGKPVADGTVVAVHWPNLMPPTASIMMHGKMFGGRDGIAGEIGKRFFGNAYHKPLDIVREAARILVTLTRVLNPHGVILYGEEFTDDTAALITERAIREIPEKYLPNFAVRQSIDEDYSLGMKVLSAKYLATLDEE